MRGGERCLEVLAELYPQADIYTLFYDAAGISEKINRHRVVSSCLNKLPGVEAYYRYLLPIYAFGLRDLERKIARENYDVVISISHCVVKNIRLPESTYHICYCLTPARYIWDKYEDYFGGSRFEFLIRQFMPRLRRDDIQGAKQVHKFIAISEFVKNRIEKYYAREAEVIYPPVSLDWAKPVVKPQKQGQYFLTVNALVPYKNTHLVIQAFNELDEPLLVVGRGPELNRLRELAGNNIRFIENVSDAELAELYRSARALVFAAEEDFGLVPLEIQAAGRPVICYGSGGVLETVSVEQGSATGLFFQTLSEEAIRAAVRSFIEREQEFSADNCQLQARQFATEIFKQKFMEVLEGNISGDLRYA